VRKNGLVFELREHPSWNFLSLDYCVEQARYVLQSPATRNALIIPILLNPISLQLELPLEQLEFLPSNGKAITEWPNRNDAFFDVTMGISRLLLAKNFFV
jgi:hypothetical protein